MRLVLRARMGVSTVFKTSWIFSVIHGWYNLCIMNIQCLGSLVHIWSLMMIRPLKLPFSPSHREVLAPSRMPYYLTCASLSWLSPSHCFSCLHEKNWVFSSNTPHSSFEFCQPSAWSLQGKWFFVFEVLSQYRLYKYRIRAFRKTWVY